ncbi:MAG: hypothetical protein Q7R51_02665 [bacterium]|nr:hypothetical protein [bacterium]
MVAFEKLGTNGAPRVSERSFSEQSFSDESWQYLKRIALDGKTPEGKALSPFIRVAIGIINRDFGTKPVRTRLVLAVNAITDSPDWEDYSSKMVFDKGPKIHGAKGVAELLKLPQETVAAWLENPDEKLINQSADIASEVKDFMKIDNRLPEEQAEIKQALAEVGQPGKSLTQVAEEYVLEFHSLYRYYKKEVIKKKDARKAKKAS